MNKLSVLAILAGLVLVFLGDFLIKLGLVLGISGALVLAFSIWTKRKEDDTET